MHSPAGAFEDRRAKSVEVIRKAYALSERIGGGKLIVAFSGGKDSQCLYHLAEEAGVPFEAEFKLTTLDPPEVLRFVRRNYPDVVFTKPSESFWKLCEREHSMPTRKRRFCCAYIKEVGGVGRVTLTGVRRQESVRRANRQEVSVRSGGRFVDGAIDQFTREDTVEASCIVGGGERIVVNPILQWTKDDVWRYLNDMLKVPHCELYDRGGSRIGCLFCPMSSAKQRIREAREYPKVFERFKQTAAKVFKHKNRLLVTPEQYIEWLVRGCYIGDITHDKLFDDADMCVLDLRPRVDC